VEWSVLAGRVQLAGRDALGETVHYIPHPEREWDTRITLKGVFHEDFVRVVMEDGIPVSTRRPMIAFHIADFEAVPIRLPRLYDTLLVRGFWNPVELEPDGEGDINVYITPAFG
jgi:hypothetical protein